MFLSTTMCQAKPVNWGNLLGMSVLFIAIHRLDYGTIYWLAIINSAGQTFSLHKLNLLDYPATSIYL
jgi:hypothetical protein